MGTPALEGQRVLIAEDDWHIAFSLKMTIEDAGARVVGPAATVARAVRLLEEENVDLALVDVNLRGEMGYPLIEALATRGIRSVVLSGYPDIQGFDKVAVLAKPVQPEALLDALRRAAENAG